MKVRTVAVLAASAAAMLASPAGATGPNQNAISTARVVKPLTLSWVQNLDLGTIILSGAGAWSGAVISISNAGVFSCSNANVTCSGSPQPAKYRVTGTNNQVVTINAPSVTLTNQNDGVTTIALTPSSPGTVNLGNSGTGLTFGVGGSISVSSTTPDGTYAGTFNVTVNY